LLKALEENFGQNLFKLWINYQKEIGVDHQTDSEMSEQEPEETLFEDQAQQALVMKTFNVIADKAKQLDKLLIEGPQTEASIIGLSEELTRLLVQCDGITVMHPELKLERKKSVLLIQQVETRLLEVQSALGISPK